MKALVKVKAGPGNLEWMDVPEPECMPDTIKVQVKYAGICGTDLHIYHDTFMHSPPVILGHEYSGVVIEVGNQITKVKQGDRVAVLPSNAGTCRSCEYCKSGYYWFCSERKGMGIGLDGCFTQYTVVQEDMVYKIPDHISFEEAALSEPLAVVVQAIEDLTEIGIGDTVLVSGPGPIGLLSLLLLKTKGCKVIISGTSTDSMRLALAKKLGADLAVDVNSEDLFEFIHRETHGKGVEISFECAGAVSSVAACLKSLKKMGKYVQVGIIGDEVKVDFDDIVYKGLQVYGSGGHSIQTWEKVMKILEQKKINLHSLITHQIPLSQWREAFDLCEKKESGKVLMYYDA